MVTRRPDRSRLPLTSKQRAIWTYLQLNPDSRAYKPLYLLRVSRAGGRAGANRAFEALVERHEVLRSTYHPDDSSVPLLCVHERMPLRHRHVDLVGRPERELAELTATAVAEPFDLTADSSIRTMFVRMSPDRLVVIVAMHHIAWDGMSMRPLIADLGDFYQLGRGGRLSIAPLELQIGDFAEWERRRAAGGAHERARRYWEGRYRTGPDGGGEFEVLALPYDYRPAQVSDRGVRLDRRVDPGAHANLVRLAMQTRAPPFAVFMAAYHLALTRITGQSDIDIGTTVANREEAGIERLIGNFSNMIPLQISTRGTETFGELVEHVRGVIAAGFDHRELSYEQIAQIAGDAGGDGLVLFDTMVLVIDQQSPAADFVPARIGWELADNGTPVIPLAVEAFHDDSGLDVQITYQSDRFAESTIGRIHDYLNRILGGARPDTRVDDPCDLSPADAADLHRWLSVFLAAIDRRAHTGFHDSADSEPDGQEGIREFLLAALNHVGHVAGWAWPECYLGSTGRPVRAQLRGRHRRRRRHLTDCRFGSPPSFRPGSTSGSMSTWRGPNRIRPPQWPFWSPSPLVSQLFPQRNGLRPALRSRTRS